jgi:hypothetical protein
MYIQFEPNRPIAHIYMCWSLVRHRIVPSCKIDITLLLNYNKIKLQK